MAPRPAAGRIDRLGLGGVGEDGGWLVGSGRAPTTDLQPARHARLPSRPLVQPALATDIGVAGRWLPWRAAAGGRVR